MTYLWICKLFILYSLQWLKKKKLKNNCTMWQDSKLLLVTRLSNYLNLIFIDEFFTSNLKITLSSNSSLYLYVVIVSHTPFNIYN